MWDEVRALHNYVSRGSSLSWCLCADIRSKTLYLQPVQRQTLFGAGTAISSLPYIILRLGRHVRLRFEWMILCSLVHLPPIICFVWRCLKGVTPIPCVIPLLNLVSRECEALNWVMFRHWKQVHIQRLHIPSIDSAGNFWRSCSSALLAPDDWRLHFLNASICVFSGLLPGLGWVLALLAARRQ